MPIAGIEFLPLELLLIAQDVPLLKKPVGRFMLWAEQKWRDFRRQRIRSRQPNHRWQVGDSDGHDRRRR